MIGRQQKQSLLAASLLSWLILFTLPLINGQVNNGTDWVQLCTQSGLKLVPIETASSTSASSTHSLDCPCLSQSLQTAEFHNWLPTDQQLEIKVQPSSSAALSNTYLLPPLRAPPLV